MEFIEFFLGELMQSFNMTLRNDDKPTKHFRRVRVLDKPRSRPEDSLGRRDPFLAIIREASVTLHTPRDMIASIFILWFSPGMGVEIETPIPGVYSYLYSN